MNLKEDVIPIPGEAKATFGFTKQNIEIINMYINRWEGAKFDRDTWVRIGEEIGWEPLTACLWHFRKLYKTSPGNDTGKK